MVAYRNDYGTYAGIEEYLKGCICAKAIIKNAPPRVSIWSLSAVFYVVVSDKIILFNDKIDIFYKICAKQ